MDEANPVYVAVMLQLSNAMHDALCELFAPQTDFADVPSILAEEALDNYAKENGFVIDKNGYIQKAEAQ